MAIACFLLVTFLPLRPLRSVPAFRLCIADLTSFDALLEVFRVAILIALLESAHQHQNEKNDENQPKAPAGYGPQVAL